MLGAVVLQAFDLERQQWVFFFVREGRDRSPTQSGKEEETAHSQTNAAEPPPPLLERCSVYLGTYVRVGTNARVVENMSCFSFVPTRCSSISP